MKLSANTKSIGAMLRVGILSASVVMPAISVYADDFSNEQDLLKVTPSGPADKPWEQHIGGAMVDTSKYKKAGPHHICFSNASVSNPWRVVGLKIMQAEADAEKTSIAALQYADAQGSDDKQISDIRAFVNGGQCDALIVSPNTSAALTPAVEEACKSLPVIVFDRSVNTSCPVTSISSIGGNAWGIAGAQYIADNLPKGGKVLMLRTAPGVDLFETRSDAANRIFKAAGITPVGAEFTGGDNAKTKAVVSDYLSRIGQIDAVWVDLGAMSVAVAEAFEDAGQPYPIITGEDQEDYLQKWKNQGFKGIAPTYPAYQWRTALQAAVKILDGQSIPGPKWVLPQPVITNETLDKYVNLKMPPLHYALCGCEDLPGYPERFGGKP